MNTPPSPEPPFLSRWQRWKLGFRITLTVGLGFLLSGYLISFFGMFLMFLASLVVSLDSTAATWISKIFAWSAGVIGLPLLMHHWCSIWGLPRIASFVDANLLKQKQRARPLP